MVLRLGGFWRLLRSWRRLLDEPLRQCLGQCSDGELLLVAQDRTDSAQNARTRDEARADVFDYIERFYNPNAGTP
jgi:hypothetical protein